MDGNFNQDISTEDFIRIASTFGELSNHAKQKNRRNALKQSIASDIEKITGEDEINLPIHKWNSEIQFFEQEAKTIGLIVIVSKDFVILKSKKETVRTNLLDLDSDTLVRILAHLENYAIEKYLNYPNCCIEHFYIGGSWATHNVSCGGFIPCTIHKDLTLEEVTQLLGRNPTDDENLYLLTRQPESRDVYDEKLDNLLLSVGDNFDGTFTGYVNPLDEDGDMDGAIFTCISFTKEEAAEIIKNFAKNSTNN